MRNIDKYKEFNESDFICDEFFQDWVKKTNDENSLFWDEWLINNPEKASVVENSKRIIRQIHFEEHFPIKEQINKSLQKSLTIIEEVENKKVIKSKVYWLPIAVRYAAVLFLLLGIGYAFYSYQQRSAKEQIATAFGNIKKVTLPDNSTIVLNANSKINYNKKWKSNQPREIWLQGEAFFNVRHIDIDRKVEPYERFIVHVKDVTIEVLGTTFDIRERRNKTEIVLQTGKIKILSAGNSRKNIIMKPGEIITIEQGKNIVESTVQAEAYSSWVQKKLVLNNASLEEIIRYLEDNYGKKIVLEDTSLLRRRIEGTIMLDNLDDALFVLSKVLNVNIINNTDATIYFMNK